MDLTPYFLHSYTELGNYGADFSNLRKAIKDKGSTAKITISEDEEVMLYPKCFFSPAEQALFAKYTNDLYQKMSEWIKTTDEKFIMIYGASDPWYSVRINDVQRENVHIFVHPEDNHDVTIANFPEPQKSQIIALLKKYML